MKVIEAEGARVERRRTAVVEIRQHLARLCRGFVWWVSLYGEVGDRCEKEWRELVLGVHDGLSNQYLPRSVWLAEGSRKKVESFLRMSEELCSEFSAEIEARGYPRVKHSMERRVSTKLGPLKTEAAFGLQTALEEPRCREWRKP
jgi:hypothetical protein